MKNRRNLWTLTVLVLGVFLWQCEENPLEPAGQSEVQISSSGFSPSTITIQAGESILWRNVDSQTHSVNPGTFMQPTQAFQPSHNMDQDRPTYVVSFNSTGTFPYYCDIHQVNVKEGTVIVQ